MRKIMWESHYYTFNNQKNIFESSEDKDDFSLSQEDDGMGTDSMHMDTMDMQEVRQIITSPFGAFLVDDALNPYRTFEFWVAHTNFTITEVEKNIIGKTEGVESAKILSPYRFIIAVGKAFTFSDVRKKLQYHLCDETQEIPEKLLPKIEKIKKRVQKYPQWAIYVLPNGNIEHTFLQKNLSNELDFKAKLKEFEVAKTKSNGILLCQIST